MWTCFKFSPMKNIFRKLSANESLIMVCVQIYRGFLSFATFLRVYSNSKEVSYLSWQIAYPNLKATCHIKLKRLLRTKFMENLLLAKYRISIAGPLISSCYFNSFLVFKINFGSKGARKNAPGKNTPGKSAPRKITPGNKPPRKNAPWKTAPHSP